jgi:hypothetical protein
MVLGVDGNLHIVADDASAFALIAIERRSGLVNKTC